MIIVVVAAVVVVEIKVQAAICYVGDGATNSLHLLCLRRAVALGLG